MSTKELKKELQNMDHPPVVLIEGSTEEVTVYKNGSFEKKTVTFEEERHGFNLRFRIRPAAIVYCIDSDQVAHVVKVAKSNPQFPLRAKSTGHDHEAESTGTDAIVIDFSCMKTFNIDKEEGTVSVSSGVEFKDIIPSLDAHNVSIPHGTCETVGVMGFTLGGGWGPWTRLHGMCCERLVGATLVDGKGKILKINENDSDEKSKELLWALRGGGGFSYGILTELVIKTFDQPKYTLRFTAKWRWLMGGKEVAPAIKILENWEKAIAPGKNERLIGTNLQIMAIPDDSPEGLTKDEEEKLINKSIHNCTFYGYYGSNDDNIEQQLRDDLNDWFADTPFGFLDIIHNDKKDEYSFSTWGRISTNHAKIIAEGREPELTHFPPDIDHPAPHKLSCRMVKKDGVGKECRKNLIRTLRSKLISREGIRAHIHTYVTLGAISGNFYSPDYNKNGVGGRCAFPYSDRPYTIQYQAWWNEEDLDKRMGKAYHVYNSVNQAMDWIQTAREFHFPQTCGSFISFKDAAIPTKDYFGESYTKLQEIKRKYSNDSDNLFRTRKAIY